jgi:hypothetical protein
MRPLGLFILLGVVAQQTAAPEPRHWTAAEDHQNMMDQLGIKALRPGPSGDESAPNHANYDEATANPFPNLPDPLITSSGKKVTTAKTWTEVRRPEIVEMFDREVLGRVPKNAASRDRHRDEHHRRQPSRHVADAVDTSTTWRIRRSP